MSQPTPMDEIMTMYINMLKAYKEEKEKQGFIPTLEMLIEELENKNN